MSDVVVFAGTTEGCEICSFLAKNKVSVLACVATDYGSKSLKEGEYLKIHAGRLNGAEMENLLKELSPGLVLDATHPYAAEVTENIRAKSLENLQLYLMQENAFMPVFCLCHL